MRGLSPSGNAAMARSAEFRDRVQLWTQRLGALVGRTGRGGDREALGLGIVAACYQPRQSSGDGNARVSAGFRTLSLSAGMAACLLMRPRLGRDRHLVSRST